MRRGIGTPDFRRSGLAIDTLQPAERVRGGLAYLGLRVGAESGAEPVDGRDRAVPHRPERFDAVVSKLRVGGVQSADQRGGERLGSVGAGTGQALGGGVAEITMLVCEDAADLGGGRRDAGPADARE